MNDDAALLIEGVAIEKPGRIVYPGTAITRGDVARYYHAVAPRLLPEIAGRPLSLLRCPDGIGGTHFFQRHPGKGIGEHVRSVMLAEKDGGVAPYLYIDDLRGLLELVRIGAIELHAWGAHAETPDRPDRLVFDLDPGPGVAWPAVVAAAREIRASLRRNGLESCVRLTGGKGVHVVAPFDAGPDWAQAKDFCERTARAGGTPPGPLRRQRAEAPAPRPHLHRLAAQLPQRDQHRRLVVARPRRRAGGHAAALGRTRCDPRRRPLRPGRRDAARFPPAHGSLGADRVARTTATRLTASHRAIDPDQCARHAPGRDFPSLLDARSTRAKGNSWLCSSGRTTWTPASTSSTASTGASST
ncbi:hypothetical protein GCM10027084_13150 [Pseudoxanthomonas sangjuensis]|uniref:non-homologous end-joining DNA ligase LigD n=1 Tax=Pseudoxanthomonas sangjuensis TaxID=1503750 RepID=UPI001FE6015F|nr:hypothetical protein [Pseudoxanthomonas sangjuensis]